MALRDTFTSLKLPILLENSARLHSHLCPKQVLGVRMGILAGQLLGLELPQKDKRVHVFVETDGCAADGISSATGCWVGRRTLHVFDFGKVAATFVDSQAGTAFRVAPQPGARLRWQEYAPDARDSWHGYLQAYQVMPDELLLMYQQVRLSLDLEAIISFEGARAFCERCSEEIMNERETRLDGKILCRTCAGEHYFEVLKAGK